MNEDYEGQVDSVLPEGYKKEEKTIYTLKMNESGRFGKWNVTRVPGGWIYLQVEHDRGVAITAVFVPFDNEFMK